jgi:signal transduction histidine kinase
MASLILILIIILVALFGGLLVFRKRVHTAVPSSGAAPSPTFQEQRAAWASKVVHDIRTPLSVIKTNSEIALMNPSLDQDTKRKLFDIIAELDKVSAILQNALKGLGN